MSLAGWLCCGHLRAHGPQCDAGTWTNAALTSPLSFARPFVGGSIARSPMLNSFLDESVTATVTVVGRPQAGCTSSSSTSHTLVSPTPRRPTRSRCNARAQLY